MVEKKMETGSVVIRAGTLIDGTGAEPLRNQLLSIEDGVISRIDQADRIPNGADVLDLSEFTVLPGLINMHVHTVLPGDGSSFESWVEHPDEIHLLKAHENAMVALRSGVTTMRDCGGTGSLMFRLRDAIRAGIVPGPRFVLSGRPLTITGGHCRYFGGETDGVEGMRLAARQLLQEGADFIKIMAAGGGTIGTYAQFPTYEVEEMRAAISEAHKIGRVASCHCIASESISRAVEAGTDHIEHCSFMAPDRSWSWDENLAQQVVDKGIYVTPTLQVGADRLNFLEERQRSGEASPADLREYEAAKSNRGNSLANARNLHELGAKLVAGSDAGWRHTGFDDFYEELVYLVEAGLTPVESIHAATGRAAEACQIDQTVGTLAPGKAADLLAVSGDVASDISLLGQPAMVIQAGRTVVDRR